MDETMPCRRPDARELHSLLEGAELAVIGATLAEIAPLVDRLTGCERLAVVGKQWWVGDLHSSARTIRTVVLVSGYDKVNAAHSLSCLLEAACPKLVVQTGVAGAFLSSGLEVGDLAVASSEIYADLGILAPEGWLSADALAEPLAVVDGIALCNTFPLDPGLVEASARIFRAGHWAGRAPKVAIGPFLTTSQVTGTSAQADLLQKRWGGIAESMEGAAAAHVCALYGAPFLQVRGISNLVVDRDRGSWKVEEAARLAAQATLMVCDRLDEVLVAYRAAGDDEGANDGDLDGGGPWTP
ncbi:MAG TPA: futalosine hydrolase [Thermoleophilia bacterium]|nr:futalosine hydrolase [Thermoleophilia bacterium]